MRRHGGPVFLVGIISLVVAGVALKRWELVVASLPGFVFFGLICLSVAIGRPRLRVRRSVEPAMLYPGETAVVTLEVSNDRATGLGIVEIFDAVPENVEITKGKNHRMFVLGPYETKMVRYEVKFQVQGETRIGPTKWRSMDKMSFFFDENVDKALTQVTVQRHVEDPRKLQVLPMRSNRPFGVVPARVKGTGSEFYGLREYISSDSLRTVNWKASARLGKLISKEFEDERLGDVVLIVDMRPASRVGEGSRNTVDAAVNGALAIAQRVLQERNRLSIVYARNKLGWISGITTRRYIQEIVDKADFPEQLEVYDIQFLPWLVRRSFWTKAYLVVLSPLLDEEMAKMLQEISLMGYDMLLISPSPASAPIPTYRSPTADASLWLTRNLVLMRRRNRLLKLSKGMVVLDWDIGEPLALAMKRVSKARGGARWQRRARSIRR